MIMIHELPFAYLHMTGPKMLILPQLLKNERYSEFVLKYKGYKILDNGAFENKVPISHEEILELAYTYNVQEIVLPDVWRDGQKTVSLHKEFMTVISKGDKKRFYFMAVPHGKSILEYAACYKEIVENIDYDTIGVNRPKGENGHIRPWIIRWLDPTRENTYHLLSLRFPNELLYYKDMPNVISCDCSDASHGKNGKIDWFEPYSRDREIEIACNIMHLNKLAGDNNVPQVL